MAKNSKKDMFAYVLRKAKEITPAVYASIAIPLVEVYGWSAEQVAELFSYSQDEWDANATERLKMIERCEALTGIDSRTE